MDGAIVVLLLLNKKIHEDNARHIASPDSGKHGRNLFKLFLSHVEAAGGHIRIVGQMSKRFCESNFFQIWINSDCDKMPARPLDCPPLTPSSFFEGNRKARSICGADIQL